MAEKLIDDSTWTPEQRRYVEQVIAQAWERNRNLSVRIYRGLHVRADSPDEQLDGWLEQRHLSFQQLELVINHIHIWDEFQFLADDEEATRIAVEVAAAWTSSLERIDPAYKVVSYEGYGPEVSFYFDGPRDGAKREEEG